MSTRKQKEKLFIVEEEWKKEWKDMPEYSNKEIIPYKSIRVYFRTQEDYERFSKLIIQNLTIRTKSVWFPKLIFGQNSNLRYSDES
jgi:hypothetical protein